MPIFRLLRFCVSFFCSAEVSCCTDKGEIWHATVIILRVFGKFLLASQMRHYIPIKRKFDTEKHTWNFTLSNAGWDIWVLKTVIVLCFGPKTPHSGISLAQFLGNFQGLWTNPLSTHAFVWSYSLKGFESYGYSMCLPKISSVPPSGETIDPIRKLGGAKLISISIAMASVEDSVLSAAVGAKSSMFSTNCMLYHLSAVRPGKIKD